MTNRNLLYEIGITLIKGIGNLTAKQILDTLGDVSLLFTERKSVLEKMPGLSRRIINEIHSPDVLKRAEKEIRFIEKSQTKTLFITHSDYPFRLKECVDAPVMLYYLGNADLNKEKIISIVGTRNATTYGRMLTEKLLQDLKETFPEVVIVSGLAYGIDIIAHRAALKESLATVGVLAHGLDMIYPSVHRNTAVEITVSGGLLTEFLSETNPDRQNFVKRNRIIAGLADCTIVVESAKKGGALITANIADSYNRDIFAFPGKTTDKYSEGCNVLIKSKRAALITSAEDIFKEMNWINPEKKQPQAIQRTILLDLNPDEQIVVDALSKNENMQLNMISIRLNMPVSKLSAILFELEMNGFVRCKPGGIYELV
ncbi:DNA processing protein DprA [Bacteroidia bacterium]|nr:DNA processing protein DprA [Bacteroidia bacterium]